MNCTQDDCTLDHAITGYFGTHYRPHRVEFGAWNSMIRRCTNTSLKHYKDYGGRGIKVCERWLRSFDNFYADVGDRPSPEHSIDRIDNDGDYEPSNVKWSTRSEQQMNRRVFKNNKSGYKGVTFNKQSKKWEVRLKGAYLGKFDSIETALATREKAIQL